MLALRLQQVNRQTNERLANNYWDHGREALRQGNKLNYLHYSSQALLVAPNESIRKSPAQDIGHAEDYTTLKNIFSHDGAVSASFSKDESRILTWSDDGTARLWDAATGTQLATSLKHDGRVQGAVFSKDESRILTWSGDGAAKLWHISGDLDFPYRLYALQVQALTGTAFDPVTGRITALPKADWEAIRAEYIEMAQKHAKNCRYPKENVYLRHFSKEAARE